MRFDGFKRKTYKILDLAYMAEDRLTNKPPEIKIELTHKCNNSCPFCFNKNISSKSTELESKDIFNLLKRIKNSGIRRVRFTGGEPLAKDDFFDILDYAKSLGLIIKLNTNGDLINQKNIKKIIDYCDDILFSLHDFKSNNIPEIIKKAQYIKSSCIVRMYTIATKENISHFEEFAKIINQIKPDIWYWGYPIPTKKEMIGWGDILNLAQKIKKSGINCKGIRFPLCNIKKDMEKYIKGCKNCGPYDHLVVAPNGDIHLCNSFDKKLGNINDDLLEIWRNHNLVKKFRYHDMLPNTCKTCKKMLKCFGGCRYSAYINSGSLKSKHPLCEGT